MFMTVVELVVVRVMMVVVLVISDRSGVSCVVKVMMMLRREGVRADTICRCKSQKRKEGGVWK